MTIQLREQLLCSTIRVHDRSRFYGDAQVMPVVALGMIYELMYDCAHDITFECLKKLEQLANGLIIKYPDLCHIRGPKVFLQEKEDILRILVSSDVELPTVDDNAIPFTEEASGENPAPRYTFRYEDFTLNFGPGTPELVRIVTLPGYGSLFYNDIAVTPGFIIDLTNISQLEYQRVDNQYQDPFLFQTSNNETTNKLFTPMATFTVNVAGQINQPATIGDGSNSTAYNTSFAFTRAMFTTATTPAYSDPEGDAAATLKITSLPAQGEIRNNGVAIMVNDEFDFTTVIDAGLLTYHPDAGETGSHAPTFTFEIADAGSGTFSS